MKSWFWQKQVHKCENLHLTIQIGSSSQGNNGSQVSCQMNTQKSVKITKIACVAIIGDFELKQRNRYRNWQPSIKPCSEGNGQLTQKVSGHLRVQKALEITKIACTAFRHWFWQRQVHKCQTQHPTIQIGYNSQEHNGSQVSCQLDTQKSVKITKI